MSTQWMQIAVVGTILTIGGPVPGAAQSSQTRPTRIPGRGIRIARHDAKTMTVKPTVAYQEAISELKHFPAGSRMDCLVRDS
jgi:hypothetical protein